MDFLVHHYPPLPCAALYCTVLHCTLLHCTLLYFTTLNYTVPVLYYTILYYTILHLTAPKGRGYSTGKQRSIDNDRQHSGTSGSSGASHSAGGRPRFWGNNNTSNNNTSNSNTSNSNTSNAAAVTAPVEENPVPLDESEIPPDDPTNVDNPYYAPQQPDYPTNADNTYNAPQQPEYPGHPSHGRLGKSTRSIGNPYDSSSGSDPSGPAPSSEG
jgi:hypothetical protein